MTGSGDWVAIIGASGGALTVIGGGVAFVWNKIEQRARDREKQNERRFTKIEGDLELCEERERQSLGRRSVQLTVIELLWQEVMRHAPGSTVLDRAKHLLDELKEHADLDAVLRSAAKLELLIDREKRK